MFLFDRETKKKELLWCHTRAFIDMGYSRVVATLPFPIIIIIIIKKEYDDVNGEFFEIERAG